MANLGICFIGRQSWLRALRLALCVGALFVLLKANQIFLLGSGRLSHHPGYTYDIAYKFLAIVDIVVCGCSVVSLLYVLWQRCYQKSHTNFYFMLFLHDLVMSLLMMAGFAAGIYMVYVDRYKQNRRGWNLICHRATKFCNKTTISVVLSFIGLICYLLLAFLAVLKIKPSTKMN